MAGTSELMARLLPTTPVPISPAATARSPHLVGERPVALHRLATPDRKPGFRFESLATEFETMECDNDSGIGESRRRRMDGCYTVSPRISHVSSAD
jgi:hypothetical protein